MKLNDRELAAVLTGLRMVRDGMLGIPISFEFYSDILTDCERLNPLSPDEVSRLCERINMESEE